MNFRPIGNTVLLTANATAKATQVFSTSSSFLVTSSGNTVFLAIGVGNVTAAQPVVNTLTTLQALTTTANANASTVTVTYSSQANVPFAKGSIVSLTGFTPSSYNGNVPVVSANLTAVKVTSLATGNVSVQGNVSQPIINGTNTVPVLAGVPTVITLTAPLTQPAVVTVSGITVSGTANVYITPGTGS
jgi:hypothetical protein